MRALTPVHWAVVVALGAFVVVQALLPVLIPRDDRIPVEFAWEMYARPGSELTFTVVSTDSRYTVDTHDFVAASRAELDYRALMPPHLCAVDPAARLVEVSDGDALIEEFPCP